MLWWQSWWHGTHMLDTHNRPSGSVVVATNQTPPSHSGWRRPLGRFFWSSSSYCVLWSSPNRPGQRATGVVVEKMRGSNYQQREWRSLLEFCSWFQRPRMESRKSTGTNNRTVPAEPPSEPCNREIEREQINIPNNNEPPKQRQSSTIHHHPSTPHRDSSQ